MTRVAEIADQWLGLCRKPPAFRASPVVTGNLPEPACVGSPEGRPGGPGAIRRGTRAALSGTKILIHNPQLLWFTLLAGLVVIVHLLAQVLIVFSSREEALLVLTFVAWLPAVFCLGFLLTGIIVSFSSWNDGTVSFIQRIALAKKYMVPLAGGSVIVTLAGIWLFCQPFLVRGMLFVRNPRWLISVDPFYEGVITSFVQTFAIELLTLFCLLFLLAGLMLSLSSKNGGRASFFQGLAMARPYLRALAGWSVVVALAGTLLYSACQFSDLLDPTWFQAFNSVPALARASGGFLLTVLSQFPFNFVLEPSQYIPLLQPGWDWWQISFALINTLILSAITVFLLVLTAFVVPLLVLEKKSLKESVWGSCALMKGLLGEVAACVLGLGIVIFAVSLMFLLFRFSGVGYEWLDSGSMYTSFSFPSSAWIAAALLYVLVLTSLTLVVATVGGIATLDLYRYAKSGRMPGSTEPELPA